MFFKPSFLHVSKDVTREFVENDLVLELGNGGKYTLSMVFMMFALMLQEQLMMLVCLITPDTENNQKVIFNNIYAKLK